MIVAGVLFIQLLLNGRDQANPAVQSEPQLGGPGNPPFGPNSLLRLQYASITIPYAPPEN